MPAALGIHSSGRGEVATFGGQLRRFAGWGLGRCLPFPRLRDRRGGLAGASAGASRTSGGLSLWLLS